MYKTIVVDLKNGHILYVGEGKRADALNGFWNGKRKGVNIKYIVTDTNHRLFISSVYENCPNAVHVFDHFHVVKLMNEKLDKYAGYNTTWKKDINKRKSAERHTVLLLEQWSGHL